MERDNQTAQIEPICPSFLTDKVFSGDILVEILGHIPYKDLLKCRRISTIWCTLLDSFGWDFSEFDLGKCHGKLTIEGLLWLDKYAQILSPDNVLATLYWCLSLVRTGDECRVIEWLENKYSVKPSGHTQTLIGPCLDVDMMTWVFVRNANSPQFFLDRKNANLHWSLEDLERSKKIAPNLDHRLLAQQHQLPHLFAVTYPDTFEELIEYLTLLRKISMTSNIEITEIMLNRAPKNRTCDTSVKANILTTVFLNICDMKCGKLTLQLHETFLDIVDIWATKHPTEKLFGRGPLTDREDGCLIMRQMIICLDMSELKQKKLLPKRIPWNWNWVDLSWYISIMDITCKKAQKFINELIGQSLKCINISNVIGVAIWCEHPVGGSYIRKDDEVLDDFVDALIDNAVRTFDSDAAEYLLGIGACANAEIQLWEIETLNELQYWTQFYDYVTHTEFLNVLEAGPTEHANVVWEYVSDSDKNEMLKDSNCLAIIREIIAMEDLERVKWIHQNIGFDNVFRKGIPKNMCLETDNLSVRLFLRKHCKMIDADSEDNDDNGDDSSDDLSASDDIW